MLLDISRHSSHSQRIKHTVHSSVLCRHDNDHTDISAISIAPTQQEVPPYLPANLPGTVMHLPHGPPEAHRDLHFRSALPYGIACMHVHITASAPRPFGYTSAPLVIVTIH